MRYALATLFVFWGGFAVMVLEIAGALFLAKDFGSSFYVWVSQIGMILTALAIGYAVGGVLADRWLKAATLAWVLVPVGALTSAIPLYSGPLMEAIVMRHPSGRPVPVLWQKLDPALGSLLIFLAPCLVLAMLPPYVTRLAACRLAEVGRVGGLIYASSTVGSIAGVFVSGYGLVEWFGLAQIFFGVGVLMIALGFVAPWLDRLWRQPSGSPG